MTKTELIALAESLYIKHHESEDCWYSCPKSEEGCCDEDRVGCTCGADAHNERVDHLVEALRNE